MAINKVVYGNQTLIDLTDSTLTSSDELVEGVIAYDRSGNRITGTADYMDKVDNPSANKILVDDGNGQAVDSSVNISDVMLNIPVDLSARGEVITNTGAGGIISSGTQLSDLATQSDLSGKQDTLTAGNGIVISGNTIINRFTNLTNVDLNTIRYNCQAYAGDSCTNKPTTNGGMFICTMGSNDGTYGAQLFITYATTNQGVYYRRFNGSAIPTAWRKLSDCYEAGDTLTYSGNGTFAGIAYSSSKNLRFFVPLDKPFTASGFTIKTLKITTRGSNGISLNDVTVKNNGSAVSGYTVSAYLAQGGIVIVVECTTAMTHTNNSNVSVSATTLTGTFS